MILSLFSLALLDRQGLELLLDLPHSPLNSIPSHSPASGEAYRRTGTPRLVALVVLEPCGRLEHMGECILMDIQALPFFGLFELSRSVRSGLVLVPYLLSGFLSVPSSLPSVLSTFDFLSPAVQIEHQSFQPFFALATECGTGEEF